jgi:hypothetical protein
MVGVPPRVGVVADRRVEDEQSESATHKRGQCTSDDLRAEQRTKRSAQLVVPGDTRGGRYENRICRISVLNGALGDDAEPEAAVSSVAAIDSTPSAH